METDDRLVASDTTLLAKDLDVREVGTWKCPLDVHKYTRENHHFSVCVANPVPHSYCWDTTEEPKHIIASDLVHTYGSDSTEDR